MARGVNKVILIGHTGQDPEIRTMPNGSPVANFRIATTDIWTDRQSGQRQERTEWHTLVAFNRLAEVTQQFVQKGTQVYVEGRLQTRKWQGQDGQDRYSTEIVINDLQVLTNGKQAPAQAQQQQGQRQAPQQQQQQAQVQQQAPQQQQAPAQVQQQAPQQQDTAIYDNFDDEIPF